MILVPLLFVLWLAIAVYAYRMILRDELRAASVRASTPDDETEGEPLAVQFPFNPYLRVF
jgi:hypothetical protein